MSRSIGDVRSATDTAGSIRAAGGAFARMEAAHEEEYFCRLVSVAIKFLIYEHSRLDNAV